ncbi:cold regulated gene 27 [Striga hermonthica]|uniref:Cold regulated gene 27 n=1 Tax=Striga hermonthica TaxID=68872 RepID=A0A9N7N0L6_STRHE|nr:cold regulated gene 27 [Striga hermonthica]
MEESVDYCREQEETSTLRSRANERSPTKWTDEKHSLYLESMEATFVNQLNKSLNFFGRHSHKSCQSGSKSSKHRHGNFHAPSGQFTVRHDGRWPKIDFSNAEVIGQNFNEEGLEDQASRVHEIKRTRTSSSNDQVVPSEKIG